MVQFSLLPVSGVNFREFKCGKCGATVIGYKRWWEHRQVHEGKTMFPCADCSYVGQGGNSIGFFGLKIGPNIGPKTGRRLKF